VAEIEECVLGGNHFGLIASGLRVHENEELEVNGARAVVVEDGGDVELAVALSPQGRKKKEMALL
jgi:hypothetical protein